MGDRVGLEISIRESADVTILDLQGRVTIGVDGDLLGVRLKTLLAKGARKLLMNLKDVTQLDSSGISAVVGAHISLSRDGGSLKLVCPRGRVQEVLEVMHVAEFIPTFEDETQALESFQTPGPARKP